MGTKEEWEEIEKAYQAREEKIKEEYGVDLAKLQKENKKVTKKIKTSNKVFEKILKIFLIIVILIFVLSLIYVRNLFAFLYKNVNIDVVENFENTYNIKSEILSTERIDEDGNGIYLMSTKGTEIIEFQAYKKWSNYYYDYSSRSLKYFYEKWENKDKSKFKSKEKIDENGMLIYQLNMNIEELNDMDIAVDLYQDFKNNVGNYLLPYWNIFVVDGDFQYPALGDGTGNDSSKNKLKREYVVWCLNNNVEKHNITEEEIKKYAKPDTIKVMYVNNKEVNMPYVIAYKYEEDDYNLPVGILEYITDAIIEKDKQGNPIKITYEGKEYIVDDEENLDKNIILSEYTMKKFNEIFGISIYYDYNTMRIYYNY